MELLNDDHSYVRNNAAFALYEFAVHYPNLINEITLQRLIELLEDKDSNVHSAVILPLSRLI